jgi:hypothetical protein
MITQMEVFTPRVTTSPLPFIAAGDESSDPIQIKNIDGLGPVNANINTTQYASQDDSEYNGSNTGNRNIVITVGLNPNWLDQTPESLRQALYAYFMPKNQVTLRFSSTHMATVQIDGIVESCTPNPFSKDPEMIISVICPKSAFVATSATIVTGVTGALPDMTPTPIVYQGTLPAGFVLDVAITTIPTATADMVNGELRVLNENPDLELFIVTATVSSTTNLELSTVTGNKYVRAIDVASGAETSILGKQAAGSSWLQLDEGINNFRVVSAQPGQFWSLEYFARYGGL